MTRSRPRLIVGVLLVALLTVTAGCTAALGGDPDPETIADELEDRNKNIEDIQGERVTTIETGNSTNRIVAEVVERPPSESRQEIIESNSEWQSEGSVIVNTGEKVISYNAERNTVTEFEVDFDRDSEATAFASQEMIAKALNDSEISYDGTDTVADRDVHVIELTDDETDGTTTLWVDQEFWYPLKYETTMGQGDQQFTTTMTYKEVTFNEGVDDSAFEFEPPANATVEDFETPETQTLESAADIDAATPYEFVEPDLPERFSFTEGTITEAGDSVTAFVSYEASDETVRFSLTDNTDRDPTGESVEIGDTEGTISEFSGQTTVTWDCDGVRYSLSGELDRETLIDSAASVSC